MTAQEEKRPLAAEPQRRRTDGELFAGLIARDEDAWEELLARFGPLVKVIAVRSGLRPAEIDDLLQATWTILLRHAPRISEPRSLGAWISTTATREAWRLTEKRGRAATDASLSLRHGSTQAHEPEPELDLESLERVQTVRDGIEALGEPCRTLLNLLFLDAEEPPYAEVARRTGMAIGSLGPTRARCLAKLEAGLRARGLTDAELDSN